MGANWSGRPITVEQYDATMRRHGTADWTAEDRRVMDEYQAYHNVGKYAPEAQPSDEGQRDGWANPEHEDFDEQRTADAQQARDAGLGEGARIEDENDGDDEPAVDGEQVGVDEDEQDDELPVDEDEVPELTVVGEDGPEPVELQAGKVSPAPKSKRGK